MSSDPAALDASGASNDRHRLGAPLLVIATAQLMLVLDDTVANVALPSIQRDLDVSAAALPWIITAYVLAFGGLLLLGGRAGDLYGRRRVLRAGIVVFTLASLLNGLAPSDELLIGGRLLQGVGAALAAPNALALIATTFPAGKPRNQAMAVYGAMSALGIVGGVLLGGVLTGWLSWRWVFLINIPIGIAVLTGTRTLVDAARNTGRLDTLGAATGTGGVLALAYAITRAGEHGWTDAVTLAAFAAAVVLGVWFVALQQRSEHPILPLGLLRDRNRSGSYATTLFVGAGLMGLFFLIVLYMQQVLGYGPIKTGVAALPFAAGIILASGVASKLVERHAPRVLAAPGLVAAAAGMLWLSALDVDSAYAMHVLPAVFLTSAGLAMAFVPLSLTVVHDVAEDQTGVASALLNTAQQIGAALGLAVLSSVATSAAADKLPDPAKQLYNAIALGDGELAAQARDALTHGYTTAFLVGAVTLLIGAIVVSGAVSTRTTHADAQVDPEGPA
jgi:EmrB/QacA subfamily drug resistance transporter